jgi:hypothetical protein
MFYTAPDIIMAILAAAQNKEMLAAAAEVIGGSVRVAKAHILETFIISVSSVTRGRNGFFLFVRR